VTFRTMMRVREGANTWGADPSKPPKMRFVGSKATATHAIKLPPAFVIPYSNKGLLSGQSKPAAITLTLPSGARLTFYPNPLMKGGDIIQFEVPAQMLAPAGHDSARSEKVIYAADCFPTQRMRKTVAADTQNVMVLAADAGENYEIDGEDENEAEASASSSEAGPSTPSDDDMWVCAKCGFHNNKLLWDCEICKEERPGKLEHVAKCVVLQTRPMEAVAAASSASAVSPASPRTTREDSSSRRSVLMGAEV